MCLVRGSWQVFSTHFFWPKHLKSILLRFMCCHRCLFVFQLMRLLFGEWINWYNLSLISVNISKNVSPIFKLTSIYCYYNRHLLTVFRTEMCRIERIIRKNGSTNWIRKWSYIVRIHLCIATNVHVAKIHSKHLCLFHYWFGKWCAWDVLSYVVINHFYCFVICSFKKKKNFLNHLFALIFLLCSVPFDWQNPLGYLIYFIIQSITVWHNFCFTSCMVTFGIGNFVMAMTGTKDMKNCLYQFNKSAKRKRYRSNAKKRLSEFVRQFPKTKKLSNKSWLDLW